MEQLTAAIRPITISTWSSTRIYSDSGRIYVGVFFKEKYRNCIRPNVIFCSRSQFMVTKFSSGTKYYSPHINRIHQILLFVSVKQFQIFIKTSSFLANQRHSSQCEGRINLLKPTGHVMHQQFNIQQLYALPTLYLCGLYLSENKQRLVPLTALTDRFL